jgi:hypothetical protein
MQASELDAKRPKLLKRIDEVPDSVRIGHGDRSQWHRRASFGKSPKVVSLVVNSAALEASDCLGKPKGQEADHNSFKQKQIKSARNDNLKSTLEPDYEPEGREFDSLRARHLFNRNVF